MGRLWPMVLGVAAVVQGVAARAQVSAYVDLSAAKLTNLVNTSVLWGPTIGVQGQFAHVSRFDLAGDVRVSLLGGKQRLDSVSVGPKFSTHVFKATAYGEFLVGYARYNDGLGNSNSASTDGQLQVVAGVDRKVTQRFDWRIFEYGYQQYYGLGGQFNPKNFSTGIVFHLGKTT